MSVIVYYHGGGWVLGDIDNQYDHLARLLVNATDSTVVLVNYRKAPEHPFPAAVDDSWQAATSPRSWRNGPATLAAPPSLTRS